MSVLVRRRGLWVFPRDVGIIRVLVRQDNY